MMFEKIRKLIVAPSSIYVIIRYVTYVLQFANAIFLARYLDGYYFGIYSFILLFMQYMSYSNLGVNDSLNTEYAANKGNSTQLKLIWNTAWSVNILLNIIITVVGCIIFSLVDDLFPAYRFNDYKYLLLAICISINLGKIYMTFYRLQGQLYKLNIQQILPNLVLFILLIILRQKIDVSLIVIALFVSNVLSLMIFRIGVPIVPKFVLKKDIASVLIRRGVTLLLYNLSFYFLAMLASSLVSLFYSVEQFGCYSFANTIVNGVVMAGGAFLFIFYPKILNRLHAANDQANRLIDRIREVYIVFMDLVSLLSVLFIIATTLVVPRYGEQMVVIYSILMLGRIINNASAGYAAFLIARGKESFLVIYGFISIAVVAICGIVVHYMGLTVETIALSVVIASLIYTFLVIRLALTNLGRSGDVKAILIEILGMNKWLACMIIIMNAYLFHSYILLAGCIMLYVIVNLGNIKNAITVGMRIISDKNALVF